MKSRIKALETTETPEQSQRWLEQIKRKNGAVANVFKMMANAPAVLQSYFNFSEALSSGVLDKRIQERIALMIAQENHCEYCLAAHSTMARKLGLSEEEILRARNGESENPRAEAALQFARQVYSYGGGIIDSTFNRVKEAEFSDEEILEIVAAVALNVLTNTLNNVAQTELDFPKAKELKDCGCGCCC